MKNKIKLSPSAYRAVNANGNLRTSLTDDGVLHAQIRFDTQAHLSLEIFEQELPRNSCDDIYVSFEIHSTQPITLWLAFVHNHKAWHKPLSQEINGTGWQMVRVNLQEFAKNELSRFKIIKLIFRQDCEIRLRNVCVTGLPKQLMPINVVVPWYGRSAQRLRARDKALAKLECQSLPFTLTVIELVTDSGLPTFSANLPHHQHLVIVKDRTYEGIFHKESLLNYFLDTQPIRSHIAYLFLDADVYAEDKDWLKLALTKLSDLMEREDQVMVQPFSSVVDDVTQQRKYSFSFVHKTCRQTLAVNSGLCWLIPGEYILNQKIRFPHTLVTGIADVGFVSKYIGQFQELPYLPAFATSQVRNINQSTFDYVDSQLTHCNHGPKNPRNYAMRDHLWQTCLDWAEINHEPAILQDDDGFLHFPRSEHPAQYCLSKMLEVDSIESVRASVLRAHGTSALAKIQHISLESSVDLASDPRSLSRWERAKWEVKRALCRVYNLGVESTLLRKSEFQPESIVTTDYPLLRDSVNSCACHPIILLSDELAVIYPDALLKIQDALKLSDVVILFGERHRFENTPASWRAVLEPPSKLENQTTAAIAFRRTWWEENEINFPHGLVHAVNFLDCLVKLLTQSYKDIPRINGYCRVLAHPHVDTTVADHNERVTNRVCNLIARDFLRLGSIETKRRKLRIYPKYSWQHHYSGHDLIKILERLEIDDGVLFNPVVDPCFSYLSDWIEPYGEPWTGIVHGVFDYPEHLPNPHHSLGHVLQREEFQQSLNYCKGIFTYSHYLKNRILKSGYWKQGVPINVLPHTTTPSAVGFRAEQFISERKKKVYAIGFYARRLSSFLDLNTGKYEKVLLAPMDKPIYQEYLQRECSRERLMDGAVTMQNRVSKANYDEMLSKSPVFLDYYDLSASNTLTECMVRNVPILIRRHPAAEEVLGSSYPLFFHSTAEAESLLNEPDLLTGHEYLAKLNNSQFYHSACIRSLQDSEIYQCL